MKSNLQKAEKKPSLLILCQLFYPELVTTGLTLTELCERLVKLGMEVEVVCGPITYIEYNDNLPKYIEHQGIKINRVWGTRFPKLNIVGRIINQITYASSVFFYLLFDRSKRPILVLTNPPFLAFFCALFYQVGIGNPYIYLIFDVYPDTAIRLGVIKENSFLTKLWEFANKFSFKNASIIVVIGRCMRKVIKDKMKKYGLDYDNKIRMIHVWSDDNLIQPGSNGKSYFIREWRLEGKFVIIYSGNMGRFHDMETIMETAKSLAGYKDIVFLFVGEGHKKARIIEFAEKWKLANCQFHTYVERNLLGDLLSCADVGLVSLLEGQEGLSVPSKTFGLMAAGLPVIGIMSKTSEIAEVLTEQGCGVVIKPGDSDGLKNVILDLYNNPSKLEIMGRNARRAIDERYNLQMAADSYYEIICNLSEKR